MKKILLKLWDIFVRFKRSVADLFAAFTDFFYRNMHKPPVVASVDETINAIVDNGWSIARFGDGEVKIAAGKDLVFQEATDFATKKMREVLSSDIDGLMIGIADIFGSGERYNKESNKHWKKHLAKFRKTWYKYLIKDKKYYNASMTRQYIDLKEKSESGEIFEHLKMIWDKKDVVLIEGEKSKMGIGNDLLDNAKSVRRIIGPSTQAFSKYDEILNEALKLPKDVMIMLALGPCATVLAYDLHNAGYQAVDIGHVDVEYEWYLSGAKSKDKIKGKMVFEAGEITVDEDIYDSKYESEIIAKIL